MGPRVMGLGLSWPWVILGDIVARYLVILGDISSLGHWILPSHYNHTRSSQSPSILVTYSEFLLSNWRCHRMVLCANFPHKLPTAFFKTGYMYAMWQNEHRTTRPKHYFNITSLAILRNLVHYPSVNINGSSSNSINYNVAYELRSRRSA